MMALAGLSILVTRPEPKGQALTKMLTKYGANAYCWPTISITGRNGFTPHLATQLCTTDALIFISTHAVEYFFTALIKKNIALPNTLSIIAVGPGTAHALIKRGLSPLFSSEKRASSEATLALPVLESVVGKKISIVRGQGGRALMCNTLTERGAIVEHIEVYRRHCPQKNITPLMTRWQQLPFDLIICTSQEGLDNLIKHLGITHQSRLGHSTVSAMNKNMLLSLKAHNVKNVLSLDSANNDDILAAIIAYRQSAKGTNNHDSH